jgi:HEAT repeat protein
VPAEDLEELREHFLTQYHQQRLPLVQAGTDKLDLADVVRQHAKLVLLGDPGSGKTTLLRYLALKHAQAMQAGPANAGSPGSTRFPIMIRIADYAEYGLPKGKSLSDFLGDYCSLHECPADGLVDLFTIQLAEGKCLILLDGLDEVVNADERRTVVRQVEEFVRRHDGKDNSFVITSRIAGYRSAPLEEPFIHYLVQEMDDSQILRFLEQWCIAVETAQTPDLTEETRSRHARREIEGILGAIQQSPGVRRLAANPLLLRILALIPRTGAQLPQKRIELYRLTADTLARTWRMSQGISESALVKDEYLTPLLSKLAYWLHVNKPTGIATEHEVYEVLGEEWASLHDIEWDAQRPNAKIQEDVKQFLLVVREHTGLFVERAPRRYGFMHLTFEEYYAARHLIARSRTRARFIREHLHNPHWNEPILLALGFVGMESPLESSELLETAILARGKDALYLGFLPSLYEDILRRDYLFALRCLAEGVPVRPPFMNRLLQRLADELLHPTGSARFRRYRQALYERLEVLGASDASSAFLKILEDALQDTDGEVRQRAEESLRRIRRHPAVDTQTPIAPTTSFKSERVEKMDLLVEVRGQQRDTPGPETGTSETETDISQILQIGRSGQVPPEGIGTLLKIAQQNSDAMLRQAGVWSLGHLKQTPPDAIAALIYAFDDPDARVRYTASVSLSLVGLSSPQIMTALLKALHDTDARVRQETIRSLVSLNGSQPEVMEALATMTMQDSEPDVRYEAALALAKQGHFSSSLSTLLLKALQAARSWSARRDAARLLGQAELIDEYAIDALLQGLLDDDNEVRAACVETLAQIGRRSPQIASTVGGKLAQAIEDPTFEKPDIYKGRSAHEYAFNGLWLMVVSGEVLAEE